MKKRRGTVLLLFVLMLCTIFNATAVSSSEHIIMADTFFESLLDIENQVIYVIPEIKQMYMPEFYSLVYQNKNITIRVDAYPDTGAIYRVEAVRQGYISISPVDICTPLSGMDRSTFMDKVYFNKEKWDKNTFHCNGYTITVNDWGMGDAYILAVRDENPDLSKITLYLTFNDALIKYKQADTINGKRQLELLSGDYIIGTHLSAGEYSVKAEKYAFFGVKRNGKNYKSEALSPDNAIGRIVLQDRDEIEISGGKVTFTPLP